MKRPLLWPAATFLALLLVLLACLWHDAISSHQNSKRGTAPTSILQTNASDLLLSHDYDNVAASETKANSLEPRVIEPYNPNDWFDWINFPGERERNMVLSAMIGSVSMMIETVKVIQQNPLHPSFQRYFRTEDLQMVVKIYENLLAVLGMQDYEHLRLCLRVNKLQIWYGDGPGQDLCATTGAHAYSWDYDDSGGFPHHYISYW